MSEGVWEIVVMDLDFNAVFILLVIWFAMSLVIVRCFMAVVNRGFLLVDYAQDKLYPGGKKEGGKTGFMDIVGAVAQGVMPELIQGVKGMMGVPPK